ncbi:phage protease [Snodgrassella sp. CFCC 13594]|uniref:phage protease n=1 Tax=Snodgrassella sp. CFCC 13594 TaxID=1775559 RepID=UPI00083585D2|nr:phage protease [Snodgrassella sp. CFCC 13594]
MPRKKQLALAALTFEIQTIGEGAPKSSRVQLLPYGEFRSATDSRPTDVPAWFLTEENGHDVAKLANAAQNDLVIDYEHQTLNKETNGQPAPAAGWMNYFEFTPQGLFADANWTDKAAQMIAAREYRYISAVFAYDTQGYVRKLYHAALTNFPALDGMDEILAAASAQFLTPPNQKENPMDLVALLRQVFQTPEATEDEMKAALSALIEKQKQQPVALSAVFDELQTRDTKIAALTADGGKQPDPAKFVSVEVMKDLQTQIAALSAQINGDKASTVIADALASGKLLPAQKDWAAGLAKTEGGLAQLTAYLGTVTPVAALGGTQTATQPPAGDKTVALTAEQTAAAKMLGMSDVEYRTQVLEQK